MFITNLQWITIQHHVHDLIYAYEMGDTKLSARCGICAEIGSRAEDIEHIVLRVVWALLKPDSRAYLSGLGPRGVLNEDRYALLCLLAAMTRDDAEFITEGV